MPDAATVGATLVYLAAAQDGGYALVLSADRAPEHLPLPKLCRAELKEQAKAFAKHIGQPAETSRRRWVCSGGCGR